MNTGEDNSEQTAVAADAELAEWEIMDNPEDITDDMFTLPEVYTSLERESRNVGNAVSRSSSKSSTQDEDAGGLGFGANESLNTSEVRGGTTVSDALPPSDAPSDSSKVLSSETVDKDAEQGQEGVPGPATTQEKCGGADETLGEAGSGKAEVCLEMKGLLSDSTGLLKKAIELDTAGLYTDALAFYKQGLEKLLASMKLCQSGSQKALIGGKCRAYLSRAEELKKTLAREGDRAGPTENVHPVSAAVTEFKVTEQPALTMTAVAGLQEAKEILLELVQHPLKCSQTCTGHVQGQTILLYGAPGTGKTMLVRALLGDLIPACNNLYYAHISDFLSRSVGARELKELFRLAKAHSSSCIFLDDLESLFCGGEQTPGQKAAMTELLCQMHCTAASPGLHFLLAATNTPLSLPASFRKKFRQLVYCPLPSLLDRKEILQTHLLKSELQHKLSEADIEELACRTEMFTGADLVVFVKDLLMNPLRQLTHFKRITATEGDVGGREKWSPCSDPSAVEMDIFQLACDQLVLPAITMEDALTVLARNRPSMTSHQVGELEGFRAGCDTTDSFSGRAGGVQGWR